MHLFSSESVLLMCTILLTIILIICIGSQLKTHEHFIRKRKRPNKLRGFAKKTLDDYKNKRGFSENKVKVRNNDISNILNKLTDIELEKCLLPDTSIEDALKNIQSHFSTSVDNFFSGIPRDNSKSVTEAIHDRYNSIINEFIDKTKDINDESTNKLIKQYKTKYVMFLNSLKHMFKIYLQLQQKIETTV